MTQIKRYIFSASAVTLDIFSASAVTLDINNMFVFSHKCCE